MNKVIKSVTYEEILYLTIGFSAMVGLIYTIILIIVMLSKL